MGLDIYFYKVKPSKGVNANSVSELDADMEKQFTRKFNKAMNTFVKLLKTATKEGDEVKRADVINKLQEKTKELMEYDFYWKKITPDQTDKEILEIVKKNKLRAYQHADIYFRKVNFVYHFFADKLVEEACIVEYDDVVELINRCNKVIAAAEECGLIIKNGEIDKDYWARIPEGKSWDDMSIDEHKAEEERCQKKRVEISTDWVEVAEEELPTQAGFFFGGTDYDFDYLYDVVDCKKQFEKLLADWKKNEVVYNVMSW